MLIILNSVHEKLLRNSEDFVWPVDSTFHGRFIIDVEFLDLKIYPLNVSMFHYYTFRRLHDPIDFPFEDLFGFLLPKRMGLNGKHLPNSYNAMGRTFHFQFEVKIWDERIPQSRVFSIQHQMQGVTMHLLTEPITNWGSIQAPPKEIMHKAEVFLL